VAPQFFEVDVYAGTRKVDDQTLMVVIDWEPANAAVVRMQLNAQVRAVADTNRAIVSDLRQYALRAFPVDANGRRASTVPVWTYRYLPDRRELERDGWWRL